MNTSHELRIFISSTFQDLQEEREHLVKKIFPEIRALCRERGITFTEVDLRWGLTEEEGTLGRIIRTCLEEIDRCRPYFIGITGERYGYVPDYLDVQKDPELLARYPWVEQAALEGASIIDMEFQHAVLRRHDDAAGVRFFFRRQRERLERPGALDRWSRDESAEDAERLEGLKQRVRSAGLPVEEFRDPVSLGEMIYDELVGIIRRDFAGVQAPTPLEEERSKHAAFAASRRHAYIANPGYLKRLNEFAAGNEQPLVIYAESGSGKSSLVAHWAQQYRQKHPDAFVVEHYVGIGAGDSDHLGIIRHVMSEIRERFARSEEIPSKPEELERDFGQWLGYASHELKKRNDPMVLVLDGLNQLRGRALKLLWLPDVIAPEIRLIVSTTVEQTLVALRNRGWEQMGMQPLSEKEREAVVVRFLSEYHKALSPEAVKRIASDTKCAHPLFLRTLLEELRLVGSHERLDRVITEYLETTGTEDLFQRVLERLEEDYSQRAVREVMSLLWASRSGLAEGELAELTGISRMKLSTLLLGLDYHLVRRDGLLEFFHDYLRRAVETRYLSEEMRKSQTHEELAGYFEGSGATERGTLELLYALEQAGSESRRMLAVIGNSERLVPLLVGESRYEVLEQCARLLQRGDCSPHDLEDALMAAAAGAAGDPDAVKTFRRVGSLLEHLGYWRSAVELAQRWRELAERRGDRAAVAGALVALAILERERGEPDASAGHLQQAIDAFRELGDRKGLASAIGSMGNVHSHRGQSDRAMECHRQQEEICRELGDRTGLATAIGSMGHIFSSRGEYDRAMECFLQAEALCRDRGDRRGVLKALLAMGNVFNSRGEYDRAMECYRQTEEACREIGDRQGLSISIGNVGNVYRNRGEYDQALECYREQEEICRAMGNRSGLSLVLGNMGTVFNNRGEDDRALECYAQKEAICREIGDRHGLSMAISHMGNVFRTRGEYDQALECYRQQEDLCRELGDRMGLSYAIGSIGGVFTSRGEFDRALECLRQSEEICREIGDRKGLSIIIGNTGTLFSDRGEYEQALECFARARREHRAIGFRHGLTYWLSGTASVLLELVPSGDRTTPDGIGMPEYLPTYVPDATTGRWHASALRQAREDAEECVAISTELTKPDTLFGGRVLLARLDAAEGDTDEARRRLEAMLGEAIDDGQRAHLYYWLWKLAAGRDAAERAAAEDCRAQALRLFTTVVALTPKYIYRKRIEELGADTAMETGNGRAE